MGIDAVEGDGGAIDRGEAEGEYPESTGTESQNLWPIESGYRRNGCVDPCSVPYHGCFDDHREYISSGGN